MSKRLHLCAAAFFFFCLPLPVEMRNGGDIAAIRSRGVSSSLLLIICRQFFFVFFLRRRKTRATKKRMWKRNAEHFGRARVPVSFHFGGSGRDNNRRIPFLFWLLGNNKQLERKWRDGWDPGSKSARYLYA